MVSVPGMTQVTDARIKDKIANFKARHSKGALQIFFIKNTLRLFQAKKMNPFSLIKLFPKKKGVYRWIERNCRALASESQKAILTEYILCTFKFGKSSGERILFWFLSWGDYSDHPYGDFLGSLLDSYKINFYFGDTDWLDTKNFAEKIKEFPDDRKFGFEIIEESGHQIMMENPLRF
jgi:hypothetical protein